MLYLNRISWFGKDQFPVSGFLPETPLGKCRVRGIDILPRPAQRFDDPGDRLLDGLFQHQFPVGDKLFWHLVAILETEHIGLGVLTGHGFYVDALWLAAFAKLSMQVLVCVPGTTDLCIIGLVIVK